jgi:hypothetical protein
VDELMEKIAEAPLEQVLEALEFLAQSLDVSEEPGELGELGESGEPAREEILADVTSLDRIALSVAALSDESREEVVLALDGTGKKQFILGGVGELVILGALAVTLVHVLVSKGKTSEEVTVTVKEPDGRTETTVRKITYGISSSLFGKAIQKAFTGGQH